MTAAPATIGSETLRGTLAKHGGEADLADSFRSGLYDSGSSMWMTMPLMTLLRPRYEAHAAMLAVDVTQGESSA